MKNKILKTFLCFVLFGLLLITVTYAETIEYPTTVKENVNQYPETGAFIIGSTRFDTQQAITASKLFKAGVNESNLYNDLDIDKEIDDTLYYYTPAGWMQLGENPDFLSEEDAAKLEDNLNIFFENNEVKTIQVEYDGNVVDVDDKNVTYDSENNRFIVPATTFSFTFTEKKVVDEKEVIIAQETTTNMDKAITTESGKVEEPVIGTVSEDYVAKVGNEYFKDLDSAITKATAENLVILLQDIDLPTGGLKVAKEVTIDLNNCNLTVKEDTSGDGVFHVVAGGNLTINGNGIVDGVGKNKYNIAVWADGGDVTINGGTYTNTNLTILDDDTDSAHFDLIYAKGKGSDIVINGGRFEGKTPEWLLNLSDNSGATITVNGGTFVGFNPADNACENPKVSFLAEGYKVTVSNNEYKVVELGENDVAIANGIAYTDLQKAVDEVKEGTTIKLLKSIDLPTAVKVTKKVTIDLNGKDLTVTKDTEGYGVFYVVEGGDLTINGEGTVNGVGNNDYNIAIFAENGKVTINGGTYTNVGAKDDGTGHFDLIYSKGKNGIVEINGGYFEGQTPAWLLNLSDKSGATISVKGGTFVGFNPADNACENPKVSFLAEGYKVTVSNDVYTVVGLGENDVAIANGIAYTDLQKAVDEVKEGTTIKLLKSIDLPTAVKVAKKVTVDLNNCNLSVTEDTAGDGVFYVVDKGDLTINGKGEVNGVGKNNYNMAIFAYNGKVTINGGTYTNADAIDDGTGHFDLIYAKGTAEIIIYGGEFMGLTSKWLLNQHDDTREDSSITVYGGKFVGYNPAESYTEVGVTNYVPEGYESVGNGSNEFYVQKKAN